jgi:hypothetical protein
VVVRGGRAFALAIRFVAVRSVAVRSVAIRLTAVRFVAVRFVAIRFVAISFTNIITIIRAPVGSTLPLLFAAAAAQHARRGIVITRLER